MKLRTNSNLIKALRSTYSAKDMRKVKRILHRQNATHAKYQREQNEVRRYSLLNQDCSYVVSCVSWSSSRDFQAFMNMHSGRFPLTSVRIGCK